MFNGDKRQLVCCGEVKKYKNSSKVVRLDFVHQVKPMMLLHQEPLLSRLRHSGLTSPFKADEIVIRKCDKDHS